MDRSVVLVTGCSSGIGRAAAKRLAKAGAHVVATARDPKDIEDLQSAAVETMQLDVTDEKQRHDVVARIVSDHGRIDGLVNNAGYGAMTAVEDTSIASLRAMFEVNLFGLHGLSLEALPHMRRQGAGRIVNVSSIAGHLAIPLMGGYCATKFAVRAMTQALHNEVRQFGVHACLVEPGVVKTNFGARSRQELEQSVPGAQDGPYARYYTRWLRMRTSSGGVGPDIIAKAIVHACLDQHPRFHYFAPFHAKVANVVDNLTPDALMNIGYRTWFRRGAKGG